MSRLKELIQEYCPDGVVYRKIGDVCKTLTPQFKVRTDDYLDDGKLPIIDQGKKFIGGYTDDDRGFPEDEYVIFGDHTCVVKYVNFPFVQGADGVKVLKTIGDVLPRYLYHCMTRIVLPAGYARHWSKMKAQEIPVPPLPVQQEIVRILDSFTDLQDMLKKEMEERKKQFATLLDHFYGRDLNEMKAKSIAGNGEIVTLGSLGTLIRGKRFVHADGVEDGIPCIHYGELYTYYGPYAHHVKSHIRRNIEKKLRYAETNDVVIVGAGENKEDIGVGVAWLGKENVAVHDACYTLHHHENPKYISYFLRSGFYHKQIKPFVSEAKICAISADGIGKAKILIPSMEEQNEIVKQLDSINILISDLIPTELTLRQRQYTYYRDKLLTFKRKES